MSTQDNLIAKAVRYALATGVAATFVSAPAAFAAEDDDAETITVTGSRIKRTDVEGPSPVTVISREDIDASGDVTVAEVLRSSSFNSFGSFREQSGFGGGAIGQAQISLRGLGSQRTLVLIDGRRMASTGSSGGNVQNLNQIPLEIVERIDVLRDGASAIYGSDAIAGVINVITRKDYEGLTIRGGHENPSSLDSGDSYRLALTSGISSAKGNLTVSVDHFERDAIYDRDFDEFAVAPDSGGFTSFGFPGTYINLATGQAVADPRCPLLPGDSALFPNSYTWDGSSAASYGQPADPAGDSICAYNFAADTKLFPGVKRDSIFVNGRYDISNNVTFVTRAIFGHNETQGRFAGAPVTTPFPTMAADNPTNPTLGQADNAPLLLLMRTVPNGFRNTTVQENVQDVFAGIEGSADLFGGMDWQLGAQHVRNRIISQTENLANKRSIQNAIDDATLDFFNVAGLDDATWLAQTSAILQGFNHTGVYEAEVKNFTVDGLAQWDLFQLNSGAVPVVVGFEYYDQDFTQINDPESNQLIIAGTSGGDNITAGRHVASLFAEINVPLLDTVELNVAARYDDYSDFGSTTNPKVGLSWRPFDELLIRGSYGEGFRAPSMSELYGNVSESFPPAIDVVGCANGVALCTPTQYRAFFGGNPDLGPEESESWTAGAVWAPTQDLSMEVSFYHIEFTGQIATISLQQAFNNESQGDTSLVTRNADGTVNNVQLTNTNLEGVETEGLDFNINYRLDFGDVGEFTFGMDVSKILKFDQDTVGSDAAGNPIVITTAFDGRVGFPDLRGTTHTTWKLGNFDASWDMLWIDSQSDDADFGTNDTWLSHDFQVGYNTPWDGRIVLGVRNAFEEDLPINAPDYGWQPLDFALYDPTGRVPYVRYEQNF